MVPASRLPVRPAQYSDSPYGGSPIGYWQTPAPTPPPVPRPGASMTAPGVFSVGYNSAPGQVPVNNMTTTNGVSNVDIPQLHRPPRSRDNDRCHHCRQKGHWKAECLQRGRPRVQGAASQKSGTRTYLKIFVAGRDSVCLLDTGCDRSMLPRRFVPHTPLSFTDVKVYAANGTTIPVLGTVTVNFEVAGVPVYCRFLVSDAVDEVSTGW